MIEKGSIIIVVVRKAANNGSAGLYCGFKDGLTMKGVNT
jgi:hypothetical protein